MSRLSRDAAFFKETRDLYDHIAPEFDRSRGNEPWQPLVQFLEGETIASQVTAMQDITTVMDLGCGNGRNLPLLAKMFPMATCTGLDISRTLLLSLIIRGQA